MRIFVSSVFAKAISLFLEEYSEKEKKVLFIPTAANVYEDTSFVDIDRDAFIENNFEINEIDIANVSKEKLGWACTEANIIFLSGGNTFYLLEKIKSSGFDKIVRALKQSQKVIVGSSAGTVVLGPDIEPISSMDDPTKANLSSFEGLHFFDELIIPHADNEKYEEKVTHICQKWKNKYAIIKLTDTEGKWFSIE